MSEDPPPPADIFALPDEGEFEPKAIAARLVAELEEFDHLRHGEPLILFLMRTEPKLKAGRRILGEMALPRVQGSLSPLFRWCLAKICGGVIPDFVMMLDQEWFTQADPNRRTALVHHELLHADHLRDLEGEPLFTADGDPRWGIRTHDLEEFDDVVRRYGDWSPDIKAFIKAAREGGAV